MTVHLAQYLGRLHRAQGTLAAAFSEVGAAHACPILAATVLTGSMSHAQQAWRTLPAGTVKVNAVFGGASGGAAHPRRGSGQGFECGPELLDEMTATKAVHLQARPPAGEPIRFAGLLAAASRIGPDSTTAVAASLRDEPPRQPVIT